MRPGDVDSPVTVGRQITREVFTATMIVPPSSCSYICDYFSIPTHKHTSHQNLTSPLFHLHSSDLIRSFRHQKPLLHPRSFQPIRFFLHKPNQKHHQPSTSPSFPPILIQKPTMSSSTQSQIPIYQRPRRGAISAPSGQSTLEYFNKQYWQTQESAVADEESKSTEKAREEDQATAGAEAPDGWYWT
jgi:hypothetical protein